MKKIINSCIALLAVLAGLSSCDKVSPTGVLIAGTGVEDRVKMSNVYYKQHKGEYHFNMQEESYSFLVGADSHLTTDTNRLAEMFDIAIKNNDAFVAHLGDIADTKAEYYISLDNTIKDAVDKWLKPQFKNSAFNKNDSIWVFWDSDEGPYVTHNNYEFFGLEFPFYPVVGNHDITHNGWALWSSMFNSSFYAFDIWMPNSDQKDHFIFLDTANGTLGKEQTRLIEEDAVYDSEGNPYRYTFVFTHTNIFRPQSWQFASTFAREETYFLLDQFTEWHVTGVFMGHVHEWDHRWFGGTEYITLPSMCEANSPEPGDYLVRVNLSDQGYNIEKVHMDYTPKK